MTRQHMEIYLVSTTIATTLIPITNIPCPPEDLRASQHTLYYLPATTGGVVLPVGMALGGVLDPDMR